MKLTDRLQRVMEEAVEDCTVAGVNLLVEKDGKEICYCEAGLADRENEKPMRRNTILRLYSQSKPVTAAAAMILMERGMLDLCQPVSEFLPAFAGQQVACETGARMPKRPVMVADLLGMTSGLVYPGEETRAGRQAGAVFEQACDRLYGDRPMTTLELVNGLAGGLLEFDPGSSWQYGTSADVLGAVIEVVSGMKFSEFLKKEIFDPLGMEDTAFWVPKQKQDRLARVYETVDREDGRRDMIRYEGCNLAIRNDMAAEPGFESGGAGLASTLDDYMRFARMLLQGGELGSVRILQPKTVQYMTGGQLTEMPQKAFDNWVGLEGFSYANLMRVCKNPAQARMIASAGEYGWDGWLGAYFANFPGENMTILMGAQKKDSGTFTLTRKVRNVILSSL